MKRVLFMLAMLPLLFAGCSEEKVDNDVIKFNDSDIALFIGDTKALIYSISPKSSENKKITWNSSNPDAVSVIDGVVKALKVGESIITVEISETQAQSTCKVTVNPKKVEGISLNESKIDIVRENTFKLIATIMPMESTNTKIKWTSSDTSIADVNSGLITAKSNGTCTIKATTDDGGFEASCIVNVLPISVNSIDIEGLYVDNPLEQQYPFGYNDLKLCHGDRLKVKIRFNPQNADNQNLTWKSSNESIATVKDGMFAITSDSKSKGNVVITAVSEDGEHTANLEITVDDVFLDAHGLSLVQSGNSCNVSFISSITTSAVSFTPIIIGSIYITDSNNSLIQIVSDIQNSGYKIIARSQYVTIDGLGGSNLNNYLSTWKFVYTYKLPWMSDFETKEVTINAHVWGSTI
jgi:uncharacterized protein YjdB